MKRKISAPIHVKSENKYRGFTGGFIAAEASRKTRREVGLILTQLPKPPLEVDGRPNEYVVTLTRISMGGLDSDNLCGAFKATRDEVAAWIGIDDGHRRIRFEYRQEGCRRKLFGIRIEIEDNSPGDDYARELAGIPNVTHEAPRRGAERSLPAPLKVKQIELVFRQSFAVLPWDQDGGEPVLTELAMKGHDPPRTVRMRIPARALSGAATIRYQPGGELVLERSLYRHDGVEIWLYSTRDTEHATHQPRSTA